MSGEVARFVGTLTAIGLFMAVVLHADAVKGLVTAFTRLIGDVFALGNPRG